MKQGFFLIIALVFLNLPIIADESGRHFMSFYTSEQTGGHFQNWSAIQDDRGVMYIGNGYGVLEYDGSTWRLITNTNKSFAFTFAKDSTGRIYVGSAGELGYLAPDSLGNMQFVSLLSYIPETDRAFNYVWKVLILKEGIFFQARERMFLFSKVHEKDGTQNSWKVKIWRPEKAGVNFVYADHIDNTTYVFHNEKGLLKMVADTFQFVPGTEKLKNSRVRHILHDPWNPGQFLVCTVNEGLWQYDGITFRRFVTEADPLLKGSLQTVKVLPDGNIVVGSNSHGLFLLDQNGKIRLHLGTSTGFLSDVVKDIFIDRQGNLWITMDGGICMLEYNSDVNYFPTQGSGATDVLRFKGNVYATTITGVVYLDRKDKEFKPVPDIPKTMSNFFCMAGGHLLVPSNSGIFELSPSGNKCLFFDERSEYGLSYLQPVSFDSLHFLAGSTTGLYLIKRDPNANRMTVEKKFEEVHEYVFIMKETEPGVFWLGTFDSGTIRVRFSNKDLNHPSIEKFGSDQGLPAGTVMVNLVNNRLVLSTNKGFYRYLPDSDRFEPDPFFKNIRIGINPSEYPAVSDKKGNIWANSGKELAFYRLLPDGSYRMEKGSFSRFFGQMVNNICPDEDSSTWLGLSGSIVCYKPLSTETGPKSWNTAIRSVRIRGDEPIYLGGEKSDGSLTAGSKISYKNNDLSFEYAGLSYIKPEYNEFSFMLEGYDQSWSSWSKDTKHNYTNLTPGHYLFRVKCRNIIGQEGKEDSFAFIITTPWYRTLWAYLVYLILAVTGIYGLLLFRTRQLRQRGRELEKIVEQRTAQIQEQKDNVEQLSKIGKDITSSLSIENIIRTVYQNVNNLMDASVFTIGLFKPDKNYLEFPAAIEKNQLLSRFTIPLDDENRLAVWCFKNRKDVIINDYSIDYEKYVQQMAKPIAGETPESILYLPLWNKDKVIGVISAQSFSKNAYSEYHLNMLRNLATYCAIALENAEAYRNLAALLDELRTAQDRLVNQSKLAALGELTAGIAHEIQNPLNFVNNFSEISDELLDELEEELVKGNFEEIKTLIQNVKLNLGKISFHGKRADSIVKSMLQHSLGSTGQKQLTDINNLCDEFFRLAYHGFRSKDKSFTAKMLTDFDPSIVKVNIVSQDIGRVLLNLISNAFYAVTERKKLHQPGYEPTVWMSTKKENGNIFIRVKDNGIGIPEGYLDKIFQPFFTTRPTGEGTGLGLSLAFDIITKGHGGELKVETLEGEGSTFIIRLPC